ncbi:MAG: hypothetical protein UU37_C0003G0017 [Candidatus Gottesmanbacteria bacterium GW2011_GWA2_41_12]|uniref:Antitoxin n=2 Tax=Candidatus Gottesmaniibacteriota TaxID=1752720 RepID=A0A0G0UHY1_9BACT|nr:MAG: hypothetical protein UT63_C0025G0036 [Candidatus Gottesmanbacteria bacterium GW2011_GWC2_39_8]KKR88443.1 MAG: hypothetical protein UU37_C0003G0017 [Candidatus Gottesmanbacteria bacterium GW2011_GWA2_41_12]
MPQYIVSNPEIMSGVPVIKGTRIPISRIVFLLNEGHTIDSVHDLYPQIEKKVLHEAVKELIREIDRRSYEKTSPV